MIVSGTTRLNIEISDREQKRIAREKIRTVCNFKTFQTITPAGRIVEQVRTCGHTGLEYADQDMGPATELQKAAALVLQSINEAK